jgi:predicted transcriptional regulator of viral defense system
MLIDRIREKIGEKLYITTQELIEMGVSKSSISYLVSTGKIKRISRAIYSLENDFIDVMYVLNNKYSIGVFSHESALYIHGLTDQIPEIHVMSVPKNYNVSKTNGIVFKYVDRTILNLGAEVKTTEFGHQIKVYNVERTICDIIKSDTKMERSIVNSAIRQYLETAKLSKLMLYAAKIGVENKVRRKLEVLI